MAFADIPNLMHFNFDELDDISILNKRAASIA